MLVLLQAMLDDSGHTGLKYSVYGDGCQGAAASDFTTETRRARREKFNIERLTSTAECPTRKAKLTAQIFILLQVGASRCKPPEFNTEDTEGAKTHGDGGLGVYKR